MRGQVLRVIAGYYDVEVGNKEYRVRGSGNLRNEKISPLVGDFVDFTEDGMLTEVFSRHSEFIRPKVANVDQAVVVMSLISPNYSSYLLNKMLAIIEAQRVKPIIVFTKSDLTEENPKVDYESQGYEVYLIDNKTQKGIDALKAALMDKLTVFMGQTGAGKTSTINSIGNLNRETQEISKALGRGKHTTRVVEVVNIDGAKIIDTPGFSSFEIPFDKLTLAKSFKDFDLLSAKCKYRSCLHVAEKFEDCAIKQAVENKKISLTRYNDYVKMMGEIK